MSETHTSGNQHAAELINDENVEVGRRFVEALLEDLKHVFNDAILTFESNRHVTKRHDGVDGH